MIKKFRNKGAVFLLTILMLPLVIKVADSSFHEHNHFVCNAKQEHHFHEEHQKCQVCCFEFPLYLSEKPVLLSVNTKFVDAYLNAYQSTCLSEPPNYSFFLRAPPASGPCA